MADLAPLEDYKIKPEHIMNNKQTYEVEVRDRRGNCKGAAMPRPIKLAIAGINGRMGRAIARAILANPEIELVGAFGRTNAAYVGQDIGNLTSTPNTGVLISNEFKDLLNQSNPDVLLDFTQAESAVKTAELALDNGVRPVIGTSGISSGEIRKLAARASAKNLGAMLVPNFSIGAVLMMEFSRQAANFFKHVEIVEMHHTRKIDAPSGTAMATAAKLASSQKEFNCPEVKEKELLAGSRGGQTSSGVRVHSLRLPGLISHQEVIFGAAGEILTIRHDSFNTECFIPGILMAINGVVSLTGLVVGLENLPDFFNQTQTEGS